MMLHLLKKIAGIFILLFVVTFPFPYQVFPNVGAYTSPIFEGLIAWAADHIFSLQKPYTAFVSSDSTGMYIQTVFLLLLASLVGIVWHFKFKNSVKNAWIKYSLTIFCRYYLALQMLIYGLNKVFKWQFYLPEPNTLFTKVGDMSPDILYWSTMGLSRPYSIFMGLMEVVPAILLLFRKTYLLGACILCLVLINVLAINLSFDISVKLYSSFLLFITLYLLAPYALILFDFFMGKPAHLQTLQIPESYQRPTYKFSKVLIISLFVVESMWVYVDTGYFNDDTTHKTHLHGAYEVESIIKNGDSLDSKHPETWKRFFVHRKGYLIIQYPDETMQDYQLKTDSINKTLIIKKNENSTPTALHFDWIEYFKTIEMKGVIEKDSFIIRARKLDISTLPALQKPFHWRVDE